MNAQIFNKIRTLKRQILPNEKMILFRSQARGDAHEDSDWDLLVLLDKEKKAFEDESTYGYPFIEKETISGFTASMGLIIKF